MVDLLTSGQTFVGRYRVTRRLALGGMGAVFEAEQIATELPVAIKVLYPHVLSSEDAIQKFTLEGRIAGRLSSDHIVRVFDAGYDEESRLPFLVMELLHGQDLQRIVEARGPFQAETVTDYMTQVAKGLDRAHNYVTRAGTKEPIVHRDLKPENLFVTQDESGRSIVKILDFGMAKVLSDTGGISQDIKGTPLFMAYEQASGGALSPQTDIWAFALTTFFLLTGRNYWKTASLPRPDLVSLFGEILTQPLAPPTARARELGCNLSVPEAFDFWFLKCLDRDPNMRFTSALVAASELAQALGSRATDALLHTKLARTSAGLFHLGATQQSGDGSLPALTKTRLGGTLESQDPETLTPAITSQEVDTAKSIPMRRWGTLRQHAAGLVLGTALLGGLFALAAFGGTTSRGQTKTDKRNADVAAHPQEVEPVVPPRGLAATPDTAVPLRSENDPASARQMDPAAGSAVKVPQEGPRASPPRKKTRDKAPVARTSEVANEAAHPSQDELPPAAETTTTETPNAQALSPEPKKNSPYGVR